VVLRELVLDPKLARFVDCTLDIPEVFRGEGEIRLIILGQDPTVKNPASRRRITTVLNLDKGGQLRDYLSRICELLALNLDEHVYATNYLKNFFVRSPTQIKEIDVFQVFGPMWLPLLREELALFPRAPVIALGQPLLAELVRGEASPRVRDYWGYTPRWKSGESGPLHYLAAQDNRLGRTVFPFPHQPSIAKRFYAERLASYTAFVREVALSR
jgi:uracil-DNA glycosylase